METLNNYVNELKEGSTQQLSEEQAKAMIKVAEGLIQTIQNGAPAPEDTKKGTLLPRLADTMRKLISREPAHESIPPPLGSPTSTHHPSTKERARARITFMYVKAWAKLAKRLAKWQQIPKILNFQKGN